METVDLLISGDWVLTLDPELGTMEGGTVAISGERIKDVGDRPRLESLYRPRRRIHVAGSVVLPGLINAHTHAAMTLFRGLADDLPLKTWLEEIIFPVEASTVSEELVYWGTLLACWEMIRAGITTFANGYFFEHRALDAVKKVGMRAVLAAGVLDFPAPSCQDPSLNVEHAIAFVNQARDEEPVRPAIFCHAPYTCSPETLVKSKEACRAHGVPFFIHCAETRWEVEEIRSRYGTTPVRHLDRLGLLDRDTVLVHGVWVDEEEIRIVACRGCSVVICTESNMKLASGIPPVVSYLREGVPLGLGTDGPASNNDLDIFTEMDRTAKLQKLKEGNPTVMKAAEVLHMASAGGARALGFSDVGLLEPGYHADLILVRTDRPHMQPLYNPVSQLVYSARSSDVEHVWIGGRHVLQNGRITTVDTEAIREKIALLRTRVKLHMPGP